MEKFVIEGGRPLKGEVKISGSKNAALPILAATLLTDQKCVVRSVPKLRDTLTMCKLLRSLGKIVEIHEDRVTVSPSGPLNYIADYKLVSTMRGSFCVLGPLLAKLGKAKVSLPGGCVIGVRPVDLHMKGLMTLGAKTDFEAGYVTARANRLKGQQVYLGGVFGSSVLATANVMMAAALAHGETIIESAACEPEVEDLGNFLSAMGAKIQGQGTPRIFINGVRKLGGADYRITSDRIEAGTFVLMAAATRSEIVLRNAHYSHLLALIDRLEQVGVDVKKDGNLIRVKPRKNLKPVSVTTYPHPGFPTDLQAQYMALMATVPGVSVITDKVFPDRFMHIAELNRMGAQIRREGGSAIVEGGKTLYGAPVMASDLRASAALVIAGLAARGKTEILRIYHLDRGYENIDRKLTDLGAVVRRARE
ncbi:MAG: UDP-N-acetylglucosamine 1-carboxyvinyltransferase [Candidatus Omnitrophota bacterium]|nr:UDP-N-acetylglucosamine 1-carboxyvinyltransferase [Candidatus Omnitrophota bacterium]MDZ4242949.1 UDP-N-acetylglucosamine 1-carboxyvinyltransferase [Candidatus Omnitrophota bacterium]